MEKIIVNALSVRGLGDVISPKVLREFHEYLSNDYDTTDTIDGVNTTVYNSEYKVGSTLTLEYVNFIGTDSTSFTVTATLKDNSNSAINGVMVYLDVNDTLLTGTTNSSGVVTFTVNTDGSRKYIFKCYYNGTSSLAGCMIRGVVYSADPNELGLIMTKRTIQTGDTVNLISTVSDDENIPIKGVTVEFYKE